VIRYALHCDRGHDFESWFPNSGAYDKQVKRGLVACPACGSAKVEKAIMAPRLGGNATAPQLPEAQSVPQIASQAPQHVGPQAPPPAASPPQPAKAPVAMMAPLERELRQKLKELRDQLTKNASYVGSRFPEEARKIHYGETEHRSIYGEASPEEAQELHEEGIELHPLPILPDDKN
jgi:hypothetical protein